MYHFMIHELASEASTKTKQITTGQIDLYIVTNKLKYSGVQKSKTISENASILHSFVM